MKKKILIVDDKLNTLRVLEAILIDEGYDVLKTQSAENAIAMIEDDASISAVLSDLKMPGMDGLDLYRKISAIQHDLPFIIMTAHGTIESAVKAMKEGVTNYLMKPLNYEELGIVLNRAIREKKMSDELADLRKEVRAKEFSKKIIGNDQKMKEVLEMVKTAGPTDAPILIHGETGTGKELIARAIHSISNRYDKPIISINSAALSETLLEDELFGHVKGAFTGATTYKKGRLESADGGTLFLDEIGMMSLSFQSKLLRFLQEGTFEPVGGLTTKKVNVRTIAATNRNLDDDIKEGRFLRDLLYRLEVIAITLPPLRERKDDIFLLVNHFIARFSEEYNKLIDRVDDEALDCMIRYQWPGNIRELENVIARGVILSKKSRFTINELPEKLKSQIQPPASKASPDNQLLISAIPEGGIKLKDIEKELIEKTLEHCDGNKSLTADCLGISRKALYKKMERFEIEI